MVFGTGGALTTQQLHEACSDEGVEEARREVSTVMKSNHGQGALLREGFRLRIDLPALSFRSRP